MMVSVPAMTTITIKTITTTLIVEFLFALSIAFCSSAIEALSLQEASDEDLANYESLTGSYLIEFDNGIICASEQ